MMNKLPKCKIDDGSSLQLLLRVLRDFRRNQGLLLSGAVAFYTLLSIVPCQSCTHCAERIHRRAAVDSHLINVPEMVIPAMLAT